MAKKKKAEVHKDLDGFEISIDPFGNISTNVDLSKINEFLDEHVEDKKVTDSSEEE